MKMPESFQLYHDGKLPWPVNGICALWRCALVSQCWFNAALYRKLFFFFLIEANLMQILCCDSTHDFCITNVWIDICKTRSAWIEALIFFKSGISFLGNTIVFSCFFSPTVPQIIYIVTQIKSTYSRCPDTFLFLKFWAWKLWIISFVCNIFVRNIDRQNISNYKWLRYKNLNVPKPLILDK